MNLLKASVIISTYNQPEWLQKVLWSYETQTERDFEIIIADDGSSKETKDVIDQFNESSTLKLLHVWHADEGFRKTMILNSAILKTTSDYLIFTDGDCIARQDFIETHLKFKEEGFFLSGGYFKLPMSISRDIGKKEIDSQQCFALSWLKERGLISSFKNNKIECSDFMETLLNRFTPTTATWNGHNSSAYKKDILNANGFDERMQYGGEDRELGERMFNAGLKAKQIRYSAICLHLDHKRGYVKPEMIEKNKLIRELTKSKNSKRTLFGIEKSES